jgi:hypothetical protein
MIAATVSPPVVSTVAVGAVDLWDIPVRHDPTLPTFRPRAEFLFQGGGSADGASLRPAFHAFQLQAICNAAATSVVGNARPDLNPRQRRSSTLDRVNCGRVTGRRRSPMNNGRRQPSSGGTSRMNREVHVRNLGPKRATTEKGTPAVASLREHDRELPALATS